MHNTYSLNCFLLPLDWSLMLLSDSDTSGLAKGLPTAAAVKLAENCMSKTAVGVCILSKLMSAATTAAAACFCAEANNLCTCLPSVCRH